jgi:hypothetical protein
MKDAPVVDIHNVQYRGFSSSISDMFLTVDQERIDCCALTCGGVMQSDRDRFLLQGVSPPSIMKRIFVHTGVPIIIFAAAMYGALHVPDHAANEFISTSLVLLFFGYFVLQCFKGRSKRMEVRKDLLWTKYQIQRQLLQSRGRKAPEYESILIMERPDDDHEDGLFTTNTNLPEYYMGQSNADLNAAHPCCLLACYRNDIDKDDDNGTLRKEMVNRNLCRRLYTGLCPSWYHCLCRQYYFLQCCGMCALAQEGREVEYVLLPPHYRRIDYISK